MDYSLIVDQWLWDSGRNGMVEVLEALASNTDYQLAQEIWDNWAPGPGEDKVWDFNGLLDAVQWVRHSYVGWNQ